MATAGTIAAVIFIALLIGTVIALAVLYSRSQEENKKEDEPTTFASPLVQGCYMSSDGMMDRFYVDGEGKACKFMEPLENTGTVFEMVCPNKVSYEVPQIYIIGTTGTVPTSIPTCTITNTMDNQVLNVRSESFCDTNVTDNGTPKGFYYLTKRGTMDVILNDYGKTGPTGTTEMPVDWLYSGPAKDLRLLSNNKGILYNTDNPAPEAIELRSLMGMERTERLAEFGLMAGATAGQVNAIGPFNPGITGAPTPINQDWLNVSQWTYIPVDVTQNKYRLCLSNDTTFCLYYGDTGCTQQDKSLSIRKRIETAGNTGYVFFPEFKDNITRSKVE